MTRLAMLLSAWLCAVAFIVPTSPAVAFQVTFVSATGSDSADCSSEKTPCIQINTALAQTDDGGEIVCIGNGYFSWDFTITRSVTIDCPPATFTFGQITINGAGIVVKLRNLSIVSTTPPSGGGSFVPFGINAINMAALIIENCNITGYATSGASPLIGIVFAPSAFASQLIVRDTVIDSNGLGTNGGGIKVAPASGGSAGVLLERVKFGYNVTAMALQSFNGPISATIADSSVTASRSNGILAIAGGQPLNLTIKNSKLVNNVGAAIQSNGAGSTVVLSGSTVTGNQVGLSLVNGGQMMSYKNNEIFGNGSDGTPIPAVPTGPQ